MPKGLPSKDSISRSPHDFGLYTAQNQPKRVPVGFRVDKGMPSKESWVGVEKSVHDRLKQAGFLIPDGALVSVAKMGKNVLLIVLLPAYYVVYTLPKWLGEELLPLLQEKINVFFNLSLNFFQKGLDPLVKAAAFIEKTFEGFKKNIAESLTKVARALNEKVERVKEAIQGQFHKIYQTLSRSGIIFEKGFLGLTASLTALREKLTDKVSLTHDRFKIVLNRLSDFLSDVKVIFQKTGERFSKGFEKLESQTSRFLNFLENRVIQLSEPLNRVFKGGVYLKEGLLKKVAPFFEKLSKKVTEGEAFLEKIVEKGKDFITSFMPKSFIPPVISQSVQTFFGVVSLSISFEGVGRKVMIDVVPYLNRLKEKLLLVKKPLIELAQFFEGYLRFFGEKIAQFGGVATRFLLEKALIGVSYLKMLWDFLMRGLMWLLYCIRVFFAVIKVVFNYLFQQLAKQ
jgi:hypothetical protein